MICFGFFHRLYHAWKSITLHFGWQWLLLLPPAMLPCSTGGKRKDVATYLENVSHPDLCTCQNQKNIFSKCETYFFGLCMNPPLFHPIHSECLDPTLIWCDTPKCPLKTGRWEPRARDNGRRQESNNQMAFKQSLNRTCPLGYLFRKYLIAFKVSFPVNKATLSISLQVFVQSDPQLAGTDKSAN